MGRSRLVKGVGLTPLACPHEIVKSVGVTPMGRSIGVTPMGRSRLVKGVGLTPLACPGDAEGGASQRKPEVYLWVKTSNESRLCPYCMPLGTSSLPFPLLLSS